MKYFCHQGSSVRVSPPHHVGHSVSVLRRRLTWVQLRGVSSCVCPPSPLILREPGPKGRRLIDELPSTPSSRRLLKLTGELFGLQAFFYVTVRHELTSSAHRSLHVHDCTPGERTLSKDTSSGGLRHRPSDDLGHT